MRAAALVIVAACSAEVAGQHEITAPGELLTEDGRLREPGWARRQLLRWDPARVADPEALRQWDFFTVLDGAAAVNLTLVDLGFLQAGVVSAVDLATGEKLESTVVRAGSDELALSAAVEGTAAFSEGGIDRLRFTTAAEGSVLAIDIASGLFGGPPVHGELVVTRRPALPYLSLATPFAGDPHQFFFEQKIPGMSAAGTITIGERTIDFAGAQAVMDWGRGQWPSEVTWRWAAASGTAGGAPLAFNFGEGFGDASAATENLVVFDDVPHKLGAVAWAHDPADPLAEWSFRSADGRVDLVLQPIAPETGGLDLGAKYQRIRKAYGYYQGTLALDDGRTVEVADLLGFAEQVEISW